MTPYEAGFNSVVTKYAQFEDVLPIATTFGGTALGLGGSGAILKAMGKELKSKEVVRPISMTGKGRVAVLTALLLPFIGATYGHMAGRKLVNQLSKNDA